MDVREYDLNLIPGNVPQIIKINQYDKGISFTFTIYQGDKKFSIPSGAIVALSGTKPDGLGFHYACTFSGSTASVTIGDQVAVLSGNVWAELTITSGDSVRLGTANFAFCVEPAALKDDTAVSDSDFPEIIKAVNNIGAAQKSADAAAKSAQDAKNSAAAVGTPLSASSASNMTDTSKIYVYTGNEDGYQNGHWYYYYDSKWTDGGIYQSISPDAIGEEQLVDHAVSTSKLADGSVTKEKLGEDLQEELLSGGDASINLFVALSEITAVFQNSVFKSADTGAYDALSDFTESIKPEGLCHFSYYLTNCMLDN